MKRWMAGVCSLMLMGGGLWLSTRGPVTMSAEAAPAKEFSRREMLRNVATQVFIPGIREFQKRCEALTLAAVKLDKKPGTENLKETQQAWREACLSWKRIQWVQFGPVKDRPYWSAITFKPVYPQSIEKVLRGAEPITQDYLAEQGAAAKGLYTLEYLLFDLPQGQTASVGENGEPTKTGPARLSEKALLDGADSARRRAYVRELAREMVNHLGEARAIIDAPGFVEDYVKGGQDTINLVVNGFLDEMESGVVNVLRLYVDQFANRSLRYEQIEGYAGGLSVRVLEEELQGLEKLYRGGTGMGLDDYVRHVNPPLSERMDTRFRAGMAALKRFRDKPVDTALGVQYADMEKAHDELHELEIQTKLDVISSLGITLLFSSTDGD